MNKRRLPHIPLWMWKEIEKREKLNRFDFFCCDSMICAVDDDFFRVNAQGEIISKRGQIVKCPYCKKQLVKRDWLAEIGGWVMVTGMKLQRLFSKKQPILERKRKLLKDQFGDSL